MFSTRILLGFTREITLLIFDVVVWISCEWRGEPDLIYLVCLQSRLETQMPLNTEYKSMVDLLMWPSSLWVFNPQSLTNF